MNIVQPYAKMLSPHSLSESFTLSDGIEMLRRIEYFGRISHRSEEAQTEGSWERFIRTIVMGHADFSIIEHASVTVEMVVDRGVLGELTRHRIGAYTVESTRFVNYEKKMPPAFINPGVSDFDVPREEIWQKAMQDAENSYQRLILLGCAPQIARSVFPMSLATKLVVTYNLRSWRHLFLMRTTKETHPQFRQISIPLLEEFKEKIPIIFDDIEPLAKQSDNLKKMR